MEAVMPTDAPSVPPCLTSGVPALAYATLLSAMLHLTVEPDEDARGGSYPFDVGDLGGALIEYDFVVVGAGTAGSALAARLSDNPAWTVLLIEAGVDPPPHSDVPRLSKWLYGTQADWQYHTEPNDASCLAYGDAGCYWPSGKTLGGTSSIDSALYHRGHPRDYDRWAEVEEGCQHWAADRMLDAFKAVENYQPSEQAGDVHGTGGHLAVEPFAEEEPFLLALLEGLQELNQTIVEDFSAAESQLGFGVLPGTVRNGTRWNTARAFLGPIKERPNLHVLKNATVTKVLIDADSKEALGVQYMWRDEVLQVRAAKEVVLTAGAIETPKLLMLSGVGPAEHLQDVGIPVIEDLPVGLNLQDHFTYRGLLLVEEYAGKKESSDGFEHMAEMYEYLLYRAGPLSAPGYTSLVGFVKTGYSADDDSPDYPDLGVFFFGLESRHIDSLLERMEAQGVSSETRDSLTELLARGDAILVAPTPLRPSSRGRVMLRSADPLEPPRIQAGYLSDPKDVETLLEGIRFALQLGRSSAVRAAGLRVRDLEVQACAMRGLPALSEEYWRCALPYLVDSLHHPAGTAPVGDVVDCRLRVKGVSRLRVADASVMPRIPSGPVSAATVAVGHRAATVIAEDWGAN